MGQPTAADVNRRGKKIVGGVKLWPVGTAAAKSEFYGWLRLDRPTAESGEPPLAGYVHLPEHAGEETVKQLVAEHRITRGGKGRARVTSWEMLRDRNEALDCRVYACAAAAWHGVDRLSDAAWLELENALAAPARPVPTRQPDPAPPVPSPARPRQPAVVRSSYLG